MTYQWDSTEYACNSANQQKWARELIAKMNLQGTESLLDIGSGDGKVTAEIASILAEGCVLGVDNSPEMVALAQTRYPRGDFSNLDFQLTDAARLPFENDFEVIFSNATLHWLLDQRPVLQGISRSLKQNGKAMLQMGGLGNAAGVVAAMDDVCSRPEWWDRFIGFEFPYGFYGAGEYCTWLLEAGLIPCRVELIPKDMAHANREAFEGWLRTTWMPYIQQVPEDQRQGFVSQVADTYLEANPASTEGIVHVQMVRLEVESKKE